MAFYVCGEILGFICIYAVLCVFRKVIKQIFDFFFYFPSKAFLRRFTVIVEVGADNDLRETNEKKSRKVFIEKSFWVSSTVLFTNWCIYISCINERQVMCGMLR